MFLYYINLKSNDWLISEHLFGASFLSMELHREAVIKSLNFIILMRFFTLLLNRVKIFKMAFMSSLVKFKKSFMITRVFTSNGFNGFQNGLQSLFFFVAATIFLPRIAADESTVESN